MLHYTNISNTMIVVRCLTALSLVQRCYQDQGVRDQDQTKTRQAETETETKTREAETKNKTKTSMVETKTNIRDRSTFAVLVTTSTHKQFSFIDFEYCTAVNVIMHKNIEIGLSNNK